MTASLQVDSVGAPSADPVELPRPLPVGPKVLSCNDGFEFAIHDPRTNVRFGVLNGLHVRMLQIANKYYQKELGQSAVVTGTTHGQAYRWEYDHQAGCAIDIRTWGHDVEKLKRVAELIAWEIGYKIDDRVRVVLFHGMSGKPNHIHIAIRIREEVGTVRDSWFSFNELIGTH